MPTYVDLNSVQNPSAGATILSAWGDQARDNFEAMRNPPRGYWNNGFQNISNNTTTTVTWANEVYDTDTMWASGNNIDINTAGYWDIRAFIEWDDPAAGTDTRRFMSILKDDTTTLGITDIRIPTSGTISCQCILPPQTFTAANFVTVHVYQNSGVTLQALVAVSALWVCPS